MSEDLEQAAERIAERGREALLARLRPAFREAAEAHADVLELTREQLEEMVQKAADRADGLQWRRALAAVACEELGIPLSQALGHAAVVRAQELVGAPSYEESLAQLSRAQMDESEPEQTDESEPEHSESTADAVEEAERQGEDWEEEAEEESAQDEAATMQYELHEIDEDEDEERFGDEDSPELRISAIHVGGIANLSPGERGIELKLAEPGLDILRGDGDVLGRLEWDQVRTLEVVPPPRRRRRRAATHLVVRTARGDASFEALELSQEELRERLAPILELYLAGPD